MKQGLRKVLVWLLPFVAGILIGAGSIALWSAKSLQFITETITLGYLAYENEEALNQYLYSPDVNISIYAMQHFIKFREDFYKKNVNQKNISQTFFHDLVISYVRLGNLYEKKGNKEKANQSFKKGLEIVFTQGLYERWKGTEKEIKDVDNLRKFVAELDNRLRKQESK